jgi:hypothetical protein
VGSFLTSDIFLFHVGFIKQDFYERGEGGWTTDALFLQLSDECGFCETGGCLCPFRTGLDFAPGANSAWDESGEVFPTGFFFFGDLLFVAVCI